MPERFHGARWICGCALAVVLAGVPVYAQQGSGGELTRQPEPVGQPAGQDAASASQITVPAGTKIPVSLLHAISTRNARENDNVYAETNFPIVLNGTLAIPPKTYVQGVISRSKRPGRVAGKGELLIHFNTLIFPNGYTLLLPGALENVPGAENARMKGGEGTIEGSSSKGKDVGTIATTTATGAGIGGLATQSAKGTGIGAGVGAVAGLATVLLTRGPELRLEKGATLEMVLERPIVIDRSRAAKSDR